MGPRLNTGQRMKNHLAPIELHISTLLEIAMLAIASEGEASISGLRRIAHVYLLLSHSRRLGAHTLYTSDKLTARPSEPLACRAGTVRALRRICRHRSRRRAAIRASSRGPHPGSPGGATQGDPARVLPKSARCPEEKVRQAKAEAYYPIHSLLHGRSRSGARERARTASRGRDDWQSRQRLSQRHFALRLLSPAGNPLWLARVRAGKRRDRPSTGVRDRPAHNPAHLPLVLPGMDQRTRAKTSSRH